MVDSFAPLVNINSPAAFYATLFCLFPTLFTNNLLFLTSFCDSNGTQKIKSEQGTDKNREFKINAISSVV